MCLESRRTGVMPEVISVCLQLALLAGVTQQLVTPGKHRSRHGTWAYQTKKPDRFEKPPSCDQVKTGEVTSLSREANYFAAMTTTRPPNIVSVG